MAFISVSDATGQLDLTLFPKQYQQFEPVLDQNRVLVVSGHLEQRERGLQLVVEQMQSARLLKQQLVDHVVDRWAVQVVNGLMTPQVNKILDRLSQVHPGPARVVVYYPDLHQQFLQPKQQSLATDQRTRAALNDAFGSANVFLQRLKAGSR